MVGDRHSKVQLAAVLIATQLEGGRAGETLAGARLQPWAFVLPNHETQQQKLWS